jgi:hypothetical protein
MHSGVAWTMIDFLGLADRWAIFLAGRTLRSLAHLKLERRFYRLAQEESAAKGPAVALLVFAYRLRFPVPAPAHPSEPDLPWFEN